MRTRATVRFVRMPPRKARLVLDEIRGKSVGDALAMLRATPQAAARVIEKLLRSAVANAEHNHQVRNLDDLRVMEAIADGGPMMKRIQPRAMGRAFHIQHRTSHVTISVTDESDGTRPRRRRGESRRAAAPAPGRPAGAGKATGRTTGRSEQKAASKEKR